MQQKKGVKKFPLIFKLVIMPMKIIRYFYYVKVNHSKYIFLKGEVI